MTPPHDAHLKALAERLRRERNTLMGSGLTRAAALLDEAARTIEEVRAVMKHSTGRD